MIPVTRRLEFSSSFLASSPQSLLVISRLNGMKFRYVLRRPGTSGCPHWQTESETSEQLERTPGKVATKWGGTMACKECGGDNLKGFSAEIAFTFTGQGSLENAPAYTIAKPVVCLECGFTELVVEKHTLQELNGGGSSQKPAG